jgi:5-methyltetrahydropteroyltriglutamate--homocysteine methyltransferase
MAYLQRTRTPFRADHVGSLLRPESVLRARAEHTDGEIDAEALRAVEDAAIRDVVRRQEDLGLQAATDGELRRAEWGRDFIFRLGGIQEGAPTTTVGHTRDGRRTEYHGQGKRVTGKVALGETIFGADFQFLASTARGAMPKLELPSPNMVHFRAELATDHYADASAFRADLAKAYAEQIRRLARLGCRYLQLDDTVFAFLNDPEWRRRVAASGGLAERQHETNIEVLNQALAGRPEGLTVAVHMCRGNFRSSWFSEGGYDYVAEATFGRLGVDAFFLEYDDVRAGGFAPLRFVPDDKVVVLGLISTKTPRLEPIDQLRRRVDEAARYVPLDRLCLSPQCGFASTVEGNALTTEQQWAKLDLVVRAASEIWR